LEFSEEGTKLLVLLAELEEFGSGIVNTVRIAVGTFEDSKDVGVVSETAGSIAVDMRQYLRIGWACELRGYIGETGFRSRVAVVVNSQFLANLGEEAA
jgi:hypothetical protein